MNIENKKLNKFIYGIIAVIVIFSLFAFVELLNSLENVEKDVFKTQTQSNEKGIKSLISEKQNSTLSVALVLAQNRDIRNFLLQKEPLPQTVLNIAKQVQTYTDYKSTWIHIINKEGVSQYRSWTKKRGDNILAVRKDLKRMLKEPKIMNSISTGIFDMTIKSMVPIFEDEKFIGSIEIITKFNSIAKKIQDEGIEPIILVDKKYKQQIKKPFSKRFIDDYYVVNTNANKTILKYIQKQGVENFWAKTGYEVKDGYFISYYHIPDVNNQLMATILFFSPVQDIQTGHLDYFKKLALVLSLSALVGFVLILILTYTYLKRKEQSALNSTLLEYNKKLQEKIDEEVANSRRKDIIVSQQSRLVALGEMLGNIAHQWRQPLSAISTATSGLQIKYELESLNKEEFLDLTDGIMNNTKFLSQTIEDFRTFFQKDKEQRQFNCAAVISDTYNIIKALYNTRHINISFDLDERINYMGYRSELSQVLLNLFNNAKDAFENNKDETKIVLIKLYEDKHTIYIEFHDSAGGVLEQNNDKIFDPYFSTKHKSNGTGIGLYMSKEIITKHFNGEIVNINSSFTVEQKKFYGANFIIKLPK